MEEGGTICFSSAGWGAVARGRSHDSRFSFSLLQKGEQISQAISSARAKVHRGIAFSRLPRKLCCLRVCSLNEWHLYRTTQK